MIALKVGGTPIELKDDISITLKASSPIFSNTGDYSYPFNIPATPGNQRILGWKHRPENAADAYAEFDAVLEIDGIMLQEGTLKVRKATSGSYEGTLYVNKGDWSYKLKALTLQDIDFSATFDFNTEAEKLTFINYMATQVYPDFQMCFPMIRNEKYFDEAPDDPRLLYMNYFEDGEIKSHFAFNGSTYYNVIVPMLYLRYVLKKIFEALGFDFDDRLFTTDEEFNHLALFNLVDCNTDMAGAGFFNYTKMALLLNYHVPTMNLNDFMTGLEKMFNVRFFVNNTYKTVVMKTVDSIVKSGECTEFSDGVLSMSVELDSEITGYHVKMTPDTEDPAFTELKGYQDTMYEVMRDPVQYFSDLNPFPASQQGDVRFVLSEKKFYRFISGVWEEIHDVYGTAMQIYEFKYGSGATKIDTKFSPLFMHDSGSEEDAAVVGCARSAWREVTPKLFFTRYVDNGPTDKKLIARPVLTNNSLYYSNGLWGTDPTGMFYKYFKAHFDWMMSTRTVKMTKKMTLMELREFDFSVKYIIGGMKYLVKSVQVQLTNKGIQPATIEACTCD